MWRNLGFSPKELLVVISLTASLMTIHMPVPGRARDQVRTIGWRANLRRHVRVHLEEKSFRFPADSAVQGGGVAKKQRWGNSGVILS